MDMFSLPKALEEEFGQSIIEGTMPRHYSFQLKPEFQHLGETPVPEVKSIDRSSAYHHVQYRGTKAQVLIAALKNYQSRHPSGYGTFARNLVSTEGVWQLDVFIGLCSD